MGLYVEIDCWISQGRLAFLHPDLGLGGAERLIVDAAVGLQQRGYQVTIYTGYHDKGHAFPETTDGTLNVGTLFMILVVQLGLEFICVFLIF